MVNNQLPTDNPSKMKRKSLDEIQDERVAKRSAKGHDIETVMVTTADFTTLSDSTTDTASTDEQNVANADRFSDGYQCALNLPEVDGAEDMVVSEIDDPRPPVHVEGAGILNVDYQSILPVLDANTVGDTVITPSDDLHPIPAHGSLVPIEGCDRRETSLPFLLLPAELRIMVYSKLFKFDQPVSVNKPIPNEFHYWTPAPRPLINLAFAMMCANKQLAGEVTQFVYTCNQFFVSTSSWLKNIGKRNKSFIEHIILDCAAVPGEVGKQLSSTMFNSILVRSAIEAFMKKPDQTPEHDFDNLRTLTFYDRWKCVGRTAVPDRLLMIGTKVEWWKMFPKLESMHFDIRAADLTPREKEYYETLCFKSGIRVTVWSMHLDTPTPHQEFKLILDPAEMDKKPEFAAEIEAKKEKLAAQSPKVISPKVINPKVIGPKSISPKGRSLKGKIPAGGGGSDINRRAVCDVATGGPAEPNTVGKPRRMQWRYKPSQQTNNTTAADSAERTKVGKPRMQWRYKPSQQTNNTTR
jgi:hypothetical protein